MARCSNCGGGYFSGISGGMMGGQMCRCNNRTSTVVPRREEPARFSRGVAAGMYPQRSYPQHQAQSFQPLSTTTDSVPLLIGIGIGVIIGIVVCLGFVFIF